jgi:hypothetical protein
MRFAKNTGLVEENRLYGIKDAFKSAKHTNFPTIAPSERLCSALEIIG